MDLNHNLNFINRLSMMTNQEIEGLDLGIQLVSKAKESDEFYFSKKEHLEPDLRKWLKQRIRRELNNLKIESGGQKKFFTAEYNHELTKPDYIAKLHIDNDEDLMGKISKLYQSFNHEDSDFLDKNAKFQVVKISKNEDNAHFIFYRGVKISSVGKKSVSRVPTVRDREQLVIQDKDVIEFGGRIELFILGNYMFILNPRTLEYAFNYDDHIQRQRDQNLTSITNMNFFDAHSKTDDFKQISSQYILSRGLASIKTETLEALEESFGERCKELRGIKNRLPLDGEERQNYLEKFKSLWPLYEHIDVENEKVRFNPEYEVTPLLHFFSDKIVESFLTKKINSETY